MNTAAIGSYQNSVAPQNSRTFADYIEVFKRRFNTFLISFISVIVLSVLAAFLIPPTYKSSSTILIEQQEIPQELVRSTVTSFADQRVQIISQRVMTRSNLLEIIQQFNLYAAERKREPLEIVLADMREDINLSMISAEVVDPRSGRPTRATIAFTLSYFSESPELAQKVADKLTSLYLNENLKTRTVMATEAAVFLADEADRQSKQINFLEKELASFKERHLGSLPELNQMNLQLMERTERELLEVERQIQSVNERKIYLGSELAQLSPNQAIFSETGERILGSVDRLKTLESKLISMMAIYSEDHPGILRARKEIEVLKRELDNTSVDTWPTVIVSNEVEIRLEKAKQDRITLRQRYAADHPDVKRVEMEINNMESTLASQSAETNSALQAKPDNPAYIQLQAQANAADSELSSLKQEQKELQKKLFMYEERITGSPQVEREFKALTRDYENAWLKYQEVKAKLMEAQLAKELESERKGERFTLIDPAQLPEEPVSPNRLAIVLLGLFISVGLGAGIMAMRESMDCTVRGAKGVALLLNVTPLAVIPYVATSEEKTGKTGKRVFLSLLLVACFAGGLAAIHFFKTPLDVLWYVTLRRFGIDV
ncbi:MAG TPA: GNVR domain-containing protein [Gammaproteobacteria bacterium]